MMLQNFNGETDVTSGRDIPAEVPKTLLTTQEGVSDYNLESESPERDLEASELSLDGVQSESEFKKVYEEILIAESYSAEVLNAQLDLVSKHIQKVRTNPDHLNNLPEKFGIRSAIACLVIKDAQSFEVVKALLVHITHITDGGRRYSGRSISDSLDLLLSKQPGAIVLTTDFPEAYGLREKIKELIYNSPEPESEQSEEFINTLHDENGFDVPAPLTRGDTIPIPEVAETYRDSKENEKTLPIRTEVVTLEQSEPTSGWSESEPEYRTLLENYTSDTEIVNSQLQWIQKSFYGEGRDLHQLEQIGDSRVREEVAGLLIKEVRDFSEFVSILKHVHSIRREGGEQTKNEIVTILVNTIKGVPGFDIYKLTRARDLRSVVEQLLLKEIHKPNYDHAQLLAELETLLK